ncbi:MAG: SAM-dependent methyltransferase, partial [Spirochaetia bacterium]|nr:SAM-dependent methyltransferase [Spirochaetia bacterium]
KLPEGQKSYSKTKPIQKREFSSLKEWWGKRVENEQAWRVPVEKIAENGWNLDIKNPFVKEEEVTHTTGKLLQMLSDSFKKSDELINELKKELK